MNIVRTLLSAFTRIRRILFYLSLQVIKIIELRDQITDLYLRQLRLSFWWTRSQDETFPILPQN